MELCTLFLVGHLLRLAPEVSRQADTWEQVFGYRGFRSGWCRRENRQILTALIRIKEGEFRRRGSGKAIVEEDDDDEDNTNDDVYHQASGDKRVVWVLCFFLMGLTFFAGYFITVSEMKIKDDVWR